MFSAFYFVGKKEKFGRAPSVPVTGEDGFIWNQDNAYKDGGMPGGLWKAQVDHTFSPNFFMSAKAAYYDTGFGLIARGGRGSELHPRLRQRGRPRLLRQLPSPSGPRRP